MLMSIKAADLQVGDIVRITAGVAGRVNEVIGVTAKNAVAAAQNDSATALAERADRGSVGQGDVTRRRGSR